jgi:AraC family transcriptional regulator
MPTRPAAEPQRSDTGRITVLRGSRLVPLLATGSVSSDKSQPWSGVLLEHHRVTPSEIAMHEHPDLCLHLQLAGTDDFEWWSDSRNRIEHTRPGSLILLPAGTRDRLRWNGSSERLILTLRRDRLRELAAQSGSTTEPDFAPLWSLHDPSLANLLAEMGREALEHWPLGSLYADLLALGLSTRLARTHAIDPIAPPPHRGGLPLPRLRQAMEYMTASLADDVRLASIARELHLSESHFAHEFRHSTGQTPYQYLLDQRMSRAQHLLRHTKHPVQYISEQVGFRSPVNFVRAFGRRFGVTPAAWRRSA